MNREAIVAQIETLKAEHQAFDERLQELDAQVWLTPDEEVERRNCQKQKLIRKDRMFELDRQLRSISNGAEASS